jgi:hypothetical protein
MEAARVYERPLQLQYHEKSVRTPLIRNSTPPLILPAVKRVHIASHINLYLTPVNHYFEYKWLHEGPAQRVGNLILV